MPSQSRNTAFQPRLCRRCPVRSQLHQNRLWRSAQGAKIFTLSKPLLGVFHNFTFDLFSSFSVFGTDRNVNFQFRLRAGGTHDNRAVIFQQELQHFRLGQPVQAISIIQQLYNLLTAKRFDIAAECSASWQNRRCRRTRSCAGCSGSSHRSCTARPAYPAG